MRSSAATWTARMAAVAMVFTGTALADPIDSVTVVDTTPPYQAGDYVLLDVTVGGYTVDPSPGSRMYLATGTTTAAGYFVANPPEGADDFNLNTFCQRGTHTPDWIRTVGFNGRRLWRDVNGTDLDFFVFETNANDTIKVKPILPDGSGGEVLGQPITFTSGFTPAGGWGDTGLDIVSHSTENRNQHGGQHIVGLAFEVTDLLDTSGTPLTRDTDLLGLQIESPGLDPACTAAVSMRGVPVDSVTVVDPTGPYQAGNYVLVDVTAGGYTIGPASTQDLTYLATGTTTAGSYLADNPPGGADDLNLNTFCRRGTESPDWIRTVGFNGHELWSDVNGPDLDFFIFETNSSDTIQVSPILPDGSGGEILGQPITFLAGYRPSGDWGDTGLDIVGHSAENRGQHNGQSIVGLAFEVTELLDPSGNRLARDTQLLGIQINSPGVDPAFIGAVVVPEPSTLALLGLGILGHLSRRRRRR